MNRAEQSICLWGNKMLNLNITETAGGPIYKQIADAVADKIANGTLEAGYKLPTVRALADELDVACGTIKHAYEYLEEQGHIEMIQGRGSFVLGKEADNANRKEKAMAAIDQLFDQLHQLGFTPREMEIYLNLKLRGLEEKYDVVKIAVVDCNPETLQLIEQQLSQIGYVEPVVFPLGRMREIAPKLNEDYDMILTTTTHFRDVEPYVQGGQILAMMSMTPAVRTTISLAKVADDVRAGIFCASDAFAGVIRHNCEGMGKWSDHLPTCLMGMSSHLEKFVEGLDLLILPEGWESFASGEEKKTVNSFIRSGGQIILYDYKIDRGSYLYVEELIKRCMNRKRSK